MNVDGHYVTLRITRRDINLNGLEIVGIAAAAIARLAPLIEKGLRLGNGVDLTLQRQLEGALQITSQAFLDADAAFQKLDEQVSKR